MQLLNLMKQKTIFDILNDLTYNKVKWEDQDQKQVQPYMLNRWLSMHPDYLEIIAYCQPTTDLLNPEFYYKFYVDLLPKQKFFTKYQTGKKDEKVNSNLIAFLSQRLELSFKEIDDLLEVVNHDDLKEYIKGHGYTDKQLKKEFGL